MQLESVTEPTGIGNPSALPGEEPVKVLYIGGQGRSGSTLLGRLLGEVPGFVNVGEIRMIWVALSENRLCGCGTPIRECAFWTAVMDRAVDGQPDIEAMLAVKRKTERLRTAPRLLSPITSPNDKRMLERYLETLSRLYAAVREVSGATVIVDGSKTPMYANNLRQSEGIDMRLLHLVRDSRAVAYSWQRKKLNPAIHWKETYFQPVPPARVALEWTAKNVLTELLTPRQIPHMFLRYEQAVIDPVATVPRLAEFMSEHLPESAFEFLSGPEITLSAHHTVTGNPDRFKSTITIRPDSEWRENMNPRQRAVVTLLTYPLLARYGYFKKG
jgi:hypothetical protein